MGKGCKYAELPRHFYGQAFRRAWVKYGINIEMEIYNERIHNTDGCCKKRHNHT